MTDPQAASRASREVRGLEYRVLGPLEVASTAQRRSAAEAATVLAVLIAAAGRPVCVDTLLQAMYGEDAAPRGKATLHTYVSNLRRVLGDVIVRQGDAYILDCADATIDAAAFEDAYRSAPPRRARRRRFPVTRGVGDVARPPLRRR